MTDSTLAIVFPGQGAQYVGMGLANVEGYDAARAVSNTPIKCLVCRSRRSVSKARKTSSIERI